MLVKRRIIPDNVTLAVSTWSIILSVFVVGKACCVSTGFEGVVIGSLSFVEFVATNKWVGDAKTRPNSHTL